MQQNGETFLHKIPPRDPELDNIQARPGLSYANCPVSWLGAMLTEWLQRAPDNTRGSPSTESLTHVVLKQFLTLTLLKSKIALILTDFVILIAHKFSFALLMLLLVMFHYVKVFMNTI